jgi:hypothetical protein
MPWPWPNCKAPRTMQSAAQTGPTMTAVLFALWAPRRAAGNEGSLPVAPFLFTGTTPPLFSSVHPRASHGFDRSGRYQTERRPYSPSSRRDAQSALPRDRQEVAAAVRGVPSERLATRARWPLNVAGVGGQRGERDNSGEVSG